MNPTASSSSKDGHTDRAGRADTADNQQCCPADRPRILAACGSARNRDALYRSCRFLNLDLDLFGGPDEIPAMLRGHHYDLVLVDLHTPKTGGLEAALQVCSLMPEKETRPRMVALKGGIQPGTCLDCGFAAEGDCMLRALLPGSLAPSVDALCKTRTSPPPPCQVSLPGPGRGSPYPSLDARHLDLMIEDGGGIACIGFLEELAAAASRDFLSRRAQVDTACRAHDGRTLLRIVHGYSGCFSSLGWTLLLGFCRRQQARLRDGQFTDWENLGAELDRLYAVTRAEMARFIESRRRSSSP